MESGLSWGEIAPPSRNLPLTIRRWRYKGVRPNLAHQTALLDLAEDLGLGPPKSRRARINPQETRRPCLEMAPLLCFTTDQ